MPWNKLMNSSIISNERLNRVAIAKAGMKYAYVHKLSSISLHKHLERVCPLLAVCIVYRLSENEIYYTLIMCQW